MDFVERWFGASPDGGSGAYEVALIFVLTSALLVLVGLPKVIASLQKRWRGHAKTGT